MNELERVIKIAEDGQKMTHSQINQPKGWGFSRKPFNLNLCLLRGKKQKFNVGFANEPTPTRDIAEQQGKDVFEYSIFGDKSGQSKIGDFA